MESILPTNEYTEVEGRVYANPQVGIDESNTFIDNLRATQGQQNQEIFTDTQMLGTDVPSDIGGLTGANSYFTSRYQTPMTNAAIGSLRATAQAAALNQVLANEQAIWKKRYQDAYRNYQKRQYDKANRPVVPTNPSITPQGDDPDYETTTPQGSSETSVKGYPGAYTVTDIAGNLHVVDMNTNDERTLSPGQTTLDRASASAAVGGGTIRVLPNGNRVLVKPGYGLTKDNGQYYLVDPKGNRTAVGG